MGPKGTLTFTGSICDRTPSTRIEMVQFPRQHEREPDGTRMETV